MYNCLITIMDIILEQIVPYKTLKYIRKHLVIIKQIENQNNFHSKRWVKLLFVCIILNDDLLFCKFNLKRKIYILCLIIWCEILHFSILEINAKNLSSESIWRNFDTVRLFGLPSELNYVYVLLLSMILYYLHMIYFSKYNKILFVIYNVFCLKNTSIFLRSQFMYSNKNKQQQVIVVGKQFYLLMVNFFQIFQIFIGKWITFLFCFKSLVLVLIIFIVRLH